MFGYRSVILVEGLGRDGRHGVEDGYVISWTIEGLVLRYSTVTSDDLAFIVRDASNIASAEPASRARK